MFRVSVLMLFCCSGKSRNVLGNTLQYRVDVDVSICLKTVLQRPGPGAGTYLYISCPEGIAH